jgi:hypothetical protein
MRRKVLLRLGFMAALVLNCSCLACVAGIALERTVLREGVPLGTTFGRKPLAVEPGRTLYEDDFENPQSGWETYNDEYVEKGYEDGAYKIYVIEKSLTTWSTIPITGTGGRNFGDFILEVEATPVGGPDENDYGVLFRYQDEDNYYTYEISADGQFAVTKVVDGQRKALADWSRTRYINQGKNANILEVVCNGTAMDFYVNGEYLAGVSDNTFSKGAIGLMAGTFTRKGVRVEFDNLRVSEIVR